MEISEFINRAGSDCLRLGDNNEMMVVENFGVISEGEFRINTHGILIICTEGMAQFDYDGCQIQQH